MSNQQDLNLDGFNLLSQIRGPSFRALDPELQHEIEIDDRAGELEVELTVEALAERLDASGLTKLRDQLDEMLATLAEKELREKAYW